jgi:putative two-component system response regulator
MNEGNILVIDDEEVICNLIKDTLIEKGYSVTTFQDAKRGIEAVRKNSFDAILVDLKMPEIDGLGILKEIKPRVTENVVIMITGYPSFETVKEALHLGAFAYIAKPFNLDELCFTIHRAVTFHRLNLENKRLTAQLAQENIILEKKILEKSYDLRVLYQRLQETYMHTVKALAQAIDAKDRYTHGHSENVTKYALMIAQEMGLKSEEIEEIRGACQLHDLGKIGIHDYILTKPGKLTPEEWEEVKLHSLKGAEILKPLDFLDGIIDLVRQHHERHDGKGYPYGLAGEQIKTGARIIAIADAFDAMTSERPYRERPLTKEGAIEEIKKSSGTQFDPKVVEAFSRIVDKL